MPPEPSPQIFPLSENERLRLLIDAVTDYAIYMLDPGGFVIEWNTGAERLKGYEASEIIGKHYSQFFTPEDRARGEPERNLVRARGTGRAESEGWRVRKDGTRFWAFALLQPIRDSRGALLGFAKVTRDMTERRSADLALAESERRFRLLVDGVIDYAIYMLDPTGIVTNWNAGAQRIKGYAAGEIVGKHFSTFYTREDREVGLPARVLETAAREGHYEAEGWRVRKDGGRFWAAVVIDAIRDERGQLIGYAKVTRDITERRQAQDALRESERQFRTLVNGVVDYALIMLDPNGIVTNWNVGAARIKGYAANEIIGQHFSRFYPENERAAGAPARALYMAEEQGRYEVEAWRVRKDGTRFWANVVIDPVRDEAGQLIGFAKITRDITERHTTQKALEQVQQQLAQSQKMEALGQLTGGVAHDFNNLLTVVFGNLRRVKRLLQDDAKGLAAAEAIEIAAKRGATLTRQLLTFARHQSLSPTVIELGERIASIRTMMAGAMGSPYKLSSFAPPDTWKIYADPSELELAIVNLTLNARDAMPRGGEIVIAAKNLVLKAGDTAAQLEGEFVAVTVADMGQGIPADLLPRVFDPFFTTKGREKGTGLGLSQVHGFAHQSGGTVKIDTELGQGTCVTLYLPRAPAEPIAAATKRDDQAAVAGERVLLIEDNPAVLDVTKMQLEEIGCDVVAVTDAESGLERATAERFDLVLSDIVMAGPMNGIELARRLRDVQPGLPVLLATGYNEQAAQIADEFIVLRKPYDSADLTRAIARVLARAEKVDPEKVVDLGAAKRQRRKDAPPH